MPPVVPDVFCFRSLGHGGQADVYLGYRWTDGEYLAVKVLREAWDPTARMAFAREVLRQKRVQNAGEVRVVGADLLAAQPFVLLEWMPSGSLADRIASWRDGGFVHSPFYALQQLYDVALQLSELHAQGIVHRDLKPANVLVDNADRLRINDLGCGATLGYRPIVLASHFYGTPAYAAPEQFKHIAGPASDVWALGMMLYEMVTGHMLPRRRVPGIWPSELYKDSIPPCVDELIRTLANPAYLSRPQSGAHAAQMIYETLLKVYVWEFRHR
ncbi:MAG: serine/threonine-protein kinase [Myxococcota bacterium]